MTMAEQTITLRVVAQDQARQTLTAVRQDVARLSSEQGRLAAFEQRIAEDVRLATAAYQSGRLSLHDYAEALRFARHEAEGLALAGGSRLARQLSEAELALVDTQLGLGRVAQQTTTATTAQQALAIATTTTTHRLEGFGRGVGQVRRSLITLSASLAGVPGVIGRLSAGLLQLAVGNAVTLGVIGGIAAIAAGYRALTREARESARAVRELSETIAQQREAQKPESVRLAEQRAQLSAALDRLIAQREALQERLRARMARGVSRRRTVERGMDLGEVFVQERITKLLEQERAKRADIAFLDQQMVEARQKIVRGLEAEVDLLARARSLRIETAEHQQRAIALEGKLLGAMRMANEETRLAIAEQLRRLASLRVGFEEEITTLERARELHLLDAKQRERILEIERLLTQELQRGNRDLQLRVQIEEQLQRISALQLDLAPMPLPEAPEPRVDRVGALLRPGLPPTLLPSLVVGLAEVNEEIERAILARAGEERRIHALTELLRLASLEADRAAEAEHLLHMARQNATDEFIASLSRTATAEADRTGRLMVLGQLLRSGSLTADQAAIAERRLQEARDTTTRELQAAEAARAGTIAQVVQDIHLATVAEAERQRRIGVLTELLQSGTLTTEQAAEAERQLAEERKRATDLMREQLVTLANIVSAVGSMIAGSISLLRGAATAGQQIAGVLSLGGGLARMFGPVGQLIGSALGVAGAIVTAASGPRDRPVPVRVTDISDRAAQRLGPDEVHITIVDAFGRPYEDLAQITRRRERRDAVVRIPQARR